MSEKRYVVNVNDGLWLVDRRNERGDDAGAELAKIAGEAWSMIPRPAREQILRWWGPAGPALELVDGWSGRPASMMALADQDGRRVRFAWRALQHVGPRWALWRLIVGHELAHIYDFSTRPGDGMLCGGRGEALQSAALEANAVALANEWWLEMPAERVFPGAAVGGAPAGWQPAGPGADAVDRRIAALEFVGQHRLLLAWAARNGDVVRRWAESEADA